MAVARTREGGTEEELEVSLGDGHFEFVFEREYTTTPEANATGIPGGGTLLGHWRIACRTEHAR